MHIKKFPGQDNQIGNIQTLSFPYGELRNKSSNNPRKVIFFGSDLGGILHVIERDKYLRAYNECLDYIRRECSGLELFYKPHPKPSNDRVFEQDYLNLNKFKIIKEKNNSEIFLWKNMPDIRYVFSANSWSSTAAYAMGISSYTFNNYLSDSYSDQFKISCDEYFLGMPESFFISNLRIPLKENKIELKEDIEWENKIRGLLSGKDGQIWMVISNTEFIVSLISISKLIKRIDKNRKINLVISRHHRWDIIDMDDVRPYFDSVEFLPRIFYTSNPRKIWNAVKVALKIKSFPVKGNDIIFSCSQAEFVENCFISYFKKASSVGLVNLRDFQYHYNIKNSIYSSNSDFRFTRGSLIFNRITEPFLGLNKTLFVFYAEGGNIYLIRYQKPINRVFKKVILLKPT